ncbi:GIY-YIG nuclease family protein [Carnobacterium maltaromaticum]|uniref:GIY-YIG nuclease family protein n=1 Tax=Carnobacterium maltaromaticum TaxID=2751 RepID=UPI001D1ECCCA|nr:GIY-YIG nuclease family protein [Carnobacterium maltaromaticum]MCC4311217.1 hypothetical protein [Carnobacterium maltaromaticum]
MGEKNLDRFVYIVELVGSNYYIGCTTNLREAKKKVFKGKGPQWTRLNKPIRLIEVIELSNCTEIEGSKEVNDQFIDYSKKYGWRNVRSGYFHLSDVEKHLSLLKKKFMIDENGIVEDLKIKISENYHLYCLLLEENRYYIGISKDPYARFYKHLRGSGKGALYTAKFPPKKIVFIQDLGEAEDKTYLQMETQATLNLMQKIGCSRVRGGDLLHVDDEELYVLWKSIISAKKNKYTFPQKWLDYSFEDFMKSYSAENISIKDIS